MLRYLTAGESHGPALLGILEGMPAGVPVRVAFVNRELARRQGGYGRGARMQIERDEVEVLAGVRHGLTLGSPIGLLIRNRDWANWDGVMGAAEPAHAAAGAASRAVTRPRPGHADLAGGWKYGHRDLRNVLERASARETAMRVAVGAICQELLLAVGVTVVAHVTSLGGVEADVAGLSPEEILHNAAESAFYCADPAAEDRFRAAVDSAREAGDTLGGTFEVVAFGVPPGLGSYVAADRRLDGRLAAALMSIPAVKGVEVGLGFRAAALPGSRVHDEIVLAPDGSVARPTNRAGGLEGGVTNGQPLVVRAAMKPISTLMKPLRSVDLATGGEAPAAVERSDVCAVPAASVVGQAAVAFVLAQALLEKCGGDSLEEVQRNLRAYLETVKAL